MQLDRWAATWGISAAALEDLRRQFGTLNTDPRGLGAKPKSEAAVQVDVRLEASRIGARLWRNNVGATPSQVACKCPACGVSIIERLQPIRYGLANDSKELNAVCKSSDLIGIRPVRIRPEHVGQVLGQFVAREIKPENWQYTGNARERAQLAFLELVASLGGDAMFANSEGTL